MSPDSPLPREEVWLCLYFTALALDVFSLGDDDATRAVAVIEQQHVHCSNRANLEPGLAVATAHALYPELRTHTRAPARELELLHDLAHWAYRFTPALTIADDNCLLLEVGGCRRLHHGLSPLLEQVGIELNARGQRCNTGLAHTPKAAWLLARGGGQPPALCASGIEERLDMPRLQAQLGEVSVAALAVDPDSTGALLQMGVLTLAELLALPTPALGKRFGSGLIRYLQQLQGSLADPQHYFVPAPRFQRGFNFNDGIAQRQMLLFPMKRLLQSFCDYLRSRQVQCHVLHWQFFDAHTEQGQLRIELSRMQQDWRDLLELSRLQLERLPLAGPVFALALHSADFFAATPGHTDLFALFADDRVRRDAGLALRDRLRARLGSAALQRVRTAASHWPEQGWQYAAIDSDSGQAPAPPPAPRPLWLLAQPQALSVRDDQPHWQGALALLRGPERIGNDWWLPACSESQPDIGQRERDYYLARTAGGSLCWIFQARESGQWFLHGLFA